MTVASFLQNIPIVGKSLGDVASGNFGGALSDLPIVGQPLGNLASGNAEGFFSSLPLVGPSLGARFAQAHYLPQAYEQRLATAKQEQQAATAETQRVHNERVSRTAAAIAKRLAGESGAVSPEQTDLLKRTFGGMLKGDENRQAFNDALELSGGDFGAVSGLFSELAQQTGGGGGTTAALQVFDRAQALRAAGDEESALRLERLYRALQTGTVAGSAVRTDPLTGLPVTAITPEGTQTFDGVSAAPSATVAGEGGISAAPSTAATLGDIGAAQTQKESAAKTIGESVIKDLDAKYAEALQAQATIEQAGRAKELIREGLITGSLPGQRLALSRALSTLTGEEVSPDATNTAEYTAIVSGFVGQAIKAFGAGTGLSDADREFAKAMAGGDLAGGSEALGRIINIMEREAARKIGNYSARRAPIVRRNPDYGELYPAIQGVQNATRQEAGAPESAPQGSDEDLAAFRGAF